MESLPHRPRTPIHPEELLREDILPTLGLTRAEFSKRLGVLGWTGSKLLQERRPLSPDRAIRLSRLLGRSPGSWLRMQQAVDLWVVEHAKVAKYARIKRLREPRARQAR
jgi:addiction module HigA family antidote